jgi:YD repeat-containing protein
MVEGYTEDTDQVVDGDECEGEGDEPTYSDEPIDEPTYSDEPIDTPPYNGTPHEPGNTKGINGIDGPTVELVDRTEYKVDRPEGDPLGQPQSITYDDGNQVRYSYDDDGELTGVHDTASGVTMTQMEDGQWVVSSPTGQQHVIDGDLSVDPTTGDLVASMNDGSTVTQHPDGRTTVKDENGNLVAVSNPNLKTAGSAEYDENGQIKSATDGKGNTYTKVGENSWIVTNQSGQVGYMNGTVTINEHTGVTANPVNQQNIQPGTGQGTVVGYPQKQAPQQPSQPVHGPTPY